MSPDMSQAACAGKTPDDIAYLQAIFDSTDLEDHYQARQICEGCSVLHLCARNVPPSTQMPNGTWAAKLYGRHGPTPRPRRKQPAHAPVDCGWCGATFVPNTALALYCSTICKRSVQRERKRANYHAAIGFDPAESRACVECGSSFVPVDPRRALCSQQCRDVRARRRWAKSVDGVEKARERAGRGAA